MLKVILKTMLKNLFFAEKFKNFNAIKINCIEILHIKTYLLEFFLKESQYTRFSEI